jgi:hypothetical protein
MDKAGVEGLDPRSKAVPVRFSVPLGTLEPGRYTCQILVLNPTTHKLAVQRSADSTALNHSRVYGAGNPNSPFG